MIRTLTTTAIAALALTVPATASAAKPTKQDRQNAAQQCKAERGTTAATREAFAAKYRNFGTCVRTVAKDEAAERRTARRNASQECRAERAADRAAFAEKYGTNKKKSNAFGKCVSATAKANKAEADQADAARVEARKDAAKTCKEERGTTAESRSEFAQKYGTNKNNRNAFGKCVSRTQAEQQEQPQS